jgi:hypothetical protein
MRAIELHESNAEQDANQLLTKEITKSIKLILVYKT